MGDVWEEGYALKELNKRSGELLERKVTTQVEQGVVTFLEH